MIFNHVEFIKNIYGLIILRTVSKSIILYLKDNKTLSFFISSFYNDSIIRKHYEIIVI